MTSTIRTTQDERSQHVVIATIDGTAYVFARHHSVHVAAQIAINARRDLNNGVLNVAGLPLAQYRTTKAGRRLLVA